MKQIGCYICFLILILNCAYGQKLHEYSCLTRRLDIKAYENHPISRSFDKEGILKTRNQYHPVNIATYGILTYYHLKKTNDSSYYQKCLEQVKYYKNQHLIDSLFRGNGIGLPYNSKFHDLKPPWYSGMAQGYAISYLLRYFELTNDTSVLNIIPKLAYVLLKPEEEGGTFSVTKEGHYWIEEYPNTEVYKHVLNGYINALIGLKEYCDYFPSDSQAKRKLEMTYQSFKESLHLYDIPGGWTTYDRGVRMPCSLTYLIYEIFQMQHLYEIFNEPLFYRQMKIWASYASSQVHINKKLKPPDYDFSTCMIQNVNCNLNYQVKFLGQYNKSLKKGLPLFVHSQSEAVKLSSDSCYRICLDNRHYKNLDIFYKYASSERKVHIKNWSPLLILEGDKVVPKEDGYYQFLISYEPVIPKSIINNFEINQVNNQNPKP